MTRLNPVLVSAIQGHLAKGETDQDIADRFLVTTYTVRMIDLGRIADDGTYVMSTVLNTPPTSEPSQQDQVKQRWLAGQTTENIANALDLTVRHVERLLSID